MDTVFPWENFHETMFDYLLGGYSSCVNGQEFPRPIPGINGCGYPLWIPVNDL